MVAQEKLAAFHVKVGYPDKWKDYSNLEIKKDSYWANACRANNGDWMICTAVWVNRSTKMNG